MNEHPCEGLWAANSNSYCSALTTDTSFGKRDTPTTVTEVAAAVAVTSVAVPTGTTIEMDDATLRPPPLASASSTTGYNWPAHAFWWLHGSGRVTTIRTTLATVDMILSTGVAWCAQFCNCTDYYAAGARTPVRTSVFAAQRPVA